VSGKTFLLLRGRVPRDRPVSEIQFDTMAACDDVWMQLIFSMAGSSGYAESWYWGGRRTHAFAPNFVERWIPDFRNAPEGFSPDVIFARGGFGEYDSVLRRHPRAFKIYYGAGRRFLPQSGFKGYDLILLDSPGQLAECKAKFPGIKASLFIKPAPDNLFFPAQAEKHFDVCFPANGSQARFKGHEFVFTTAPKSLRIMNLGNPSPYPEPGHIFRIRVPRGRVPVHMRQCKVGIVCSDSQVDSCPRVIPEMLACGLPVVVLDQTRFWVDKYINSMTGRIASRERFWETVEEVLENLETFSPRRYYEKNLSLPAAVALLRERIGNAMSPA
jgi:hypothetical protein